MHGANAVLISSLLYDWRDSCGPDRDCERTECGPRVVKCPHAEPVTAPTVNDKFLLLVQLVVNCCFKSPVVCHPPSCSLCSFMSFLSQTAGLHPTAEQIEMFAYHLPDATLSNLVVSIILYPFILLPLLSTSTYVCEQAVLNWNRLHSELHFVYLTSVKSQSHKPLNHQNSHTFVNSFQCAKSEAKTVRKLVSGPCVKNSPPQEKVNSFIFCCPGFHVMWTSLHSV